jgi:hypothetical protein
LLAAKNGCFGRIFSYYKVYQDAREVIKEFIRPDKLNFKMVFSIFWLIGFSIEHWQATKPCPQDSYGERALYINEGWSPSQK